MIEQIEKASKMKCDIRCSSKTPCWKNIILNDHAKKTFIGEGFENVCKISDPKINMNYCVKSRKLDKEEINQEEKYIEDDIMKYRDIIKHPRIIEYFGSIMCSGKIYIFMEYAANGSLYNEIQKEKSLPHQSIIRYSKQILEGIEFLHDQKVIHRDIKPKNILLDDNDNIKLCDFSLSKIFSTSDIQRKGAVTSTLCGTANYMAPEVVNGEEYSFPADIWSAGATIVHMLTGRPPYSNLPIEAAIMFRIAMTRKIEFTPLEPMTDNMKSFMEEILNPDSLKRLTAKELIEFLNTHDMV